MRIQHTPTSCAGLLQRAVTDPGTLSRAYRQFHAYSLGNQLLAWSQCEAREIPAGPMATYPRWKELGRQVRKGEKALTLCMPVTVKRKGNPGDDGDQDQIFTRFIYKARWFVLSQTDGEAITEPEIPAWDKDRALRALNVEEIPFDLPDGNCLGFARERQIAINPVNPLPHRTRFHELAHVLLGHTADGPQQDGDEVLPQRLEECEAEAVALLCCSALELPGADESRGYIQHWWGQGHPIPERSAQRVLKVADQILKAGTGAGVRS